MKSEQKIKLFRYAELLLRQTRKEQLSDEEVKEMEQIRWDLDLSETQIIELASQEVRY
ncbi:MAG TPA: hypothetical protein PLB51_02190 [Candidatus Paceibacterota bacterium]|nr:hypothetical protein [Candidatus Paceibacterota bacterium]